MLDPKTVANAPLSGAAQQRAIEEWNQTLLRPFSFGETLTAELANYDATYVYGRGKKREYRGETTGVGSLPANNLGLHDMHGNV